MSWLVIQSLLGASFLRLIEKTSVEIEILIKSLNLDFRSQRTQTLDLTRVKRNLDFGSDQSPSLA